MNKLMMMMPKMEEAGEGGGGGSAAPANTAPAEGGEEKNEGGEGTPAAPAKEGEQAVPYLGEPEPVKKEGEGEAEPAKKEGEEKAEPAKEEDYIKAVVKDESVLGKDDSVQLDSGLVKAMIPTAQELGVSPSQMNKLANAMAKAQIEQGKEALAKRMEYFTKMRDESTKKYTPKDFEQINSGIDKWFKPNGVMNHVIRNSELGADPEFLALMHHLGAAAKQDGIEGAGSGSGTGAGDGNGIDGLAKIW